MLLPKFFCYNICFLQKCDLFYDLLSMAFVRRIKFLSKSGQINKYLLRNPHPKLEPDLDFPIEFQKPSLVHKTNRLEILQQNLLLKPKPDILDLEIGKNFLFLFDFHSQSKYFPFIKLWEKDKDEIENGLRSCDIKFWLWRWINPSTICIAMLKIFLVDSKG